MFQEDDDDEVPKFNSFQFFDEKMYSLNAETFSHTVSHRVVNLSSSLFSDMLFSITQLFQPLMPLPLLI